MARCGEDSTEANVTVVVRVRPLSAREVAREQATLIRVDPLGHSTTVLTPPLLPDQQGRTGRRRAEPARTFTFDHCLDSLTRSAPQYASQQKLYDALGRTHIDHALKGYNCCIFAYGQTGSGKTHSMIGTETEPGLIPQICTCLFETVRANPESFEVYVSYYEIYNEAATDLLLPRARKSQGPEKRLKIREAPDTGPYLESLSEFKVQTAQDVQAFMDVGNAARRTASTKMNDTSSRSHAIFTLTIRKTGDASVTTSRFRLVDLAGSERASATGATGERLREGANINKSLTTLGRVIAMLADKKAQGVVPYRDSILTWLLSDSLGGNSKTAMLACISPVDYEETLTTLRYANAVKRIATKAVVNTLSEQHQTAALDAQLRETMQLLEVTKRENAELLIFEKQTRTLRELLDAINAKSNAQIGRLERENEALRTHLRLAVEALRNPFHVTPDLSDHGSDSSDFSEDDGWPQASYKPDSKLSTVISSTSTDLISLATQINDLATDTQSWRESISMGSGLQFQ